MANSRPKSAGLADPAKVLARRITDLTRRVRTLELRPDLKDEGGGSDPSTVRGFYAQQSRAPGGTDELDLSAGPIDLWWQNNATHPELVTGGFGGHSIRREWWPQPDGFLLDDPDEPYGQLWSVPESAHYQVSAKCSLGNLGDGGAGMKAGTDTTWVFTLMLVIQGSVAGWDSCSYNWETDPVMTFRTLTIEESLYIAAGDLVKVMLRGHDQANLPGPGSPNLMNMTTVFGGPIPGHADIYSARGGHFSAAKIGAGVPETETPFLL